MYCELVSILGKIQGACIKNEILLQNSMSDSWKEATRIKGFGMGNSEADEVFGIVRGDENVESVENNPDAADGEASPTTDSAPHTSNGTSDGPLSGRKGSIMREEHRAAFKNSQTLRYLLSVIPSSITSFFHVLGKGLLSKRRLDSYQRQSASAVADALADAIIEQLKVPKGEFNDSLVDLYAYWIVNLASISQLMIESKWLNPLKTSQNSDVYFLRFGRATPTSICDHGSSCIS
jgi:E3 ubiquitin-protein ligase HUWE1